MVMPSLLVELAIALVAATIGSIVAVRLGLSPIIGYIVAGVVIGPYTPGLVGDSEVVHALADIGVVFLMFAIGAQTSLPDLARVGRIATVGAVLQTLAVLGAGFALGLALGFEPLEAVFLGAVVSNSSSTVLGKILAERGETETEHGHTALAWSTVQDLGTVVLIIVLSALATGSETLGHDLSVGMLAAAAFLGLALVVGGRVVPAMFEALARLRSREVFVLGVASLALGTAFGASLFGISLAIGAFLAGVVVGGSDLSGRVVAEALPIRDLFAGVFFVSIGMLLDPFFLAGHLPAVLLVLVLIVAFKGSVTAALARALGRPWRSSIVTGAVLAQCAEFSFLMARVGMDLGVVGEQAFGLMLGAAAMSVVLAPSVLSGGHRLGAWVDRRPDPESAVPTTPDDGRPLAVVCGYGRVGRIVGAALEGQGMRYRVIEEDRRIVDELRARGVPTVRGSAANRAALELAGVSNADVLVIALPDPFTVRTVTLEARDLSRRLAIVARAHRPDERARLLRMGVDEVVVGEIELGFEVSRFTLRAMGAGSHETQDVVARLRQLDGATAVGAPEVAPNHPSG